MLHSVEGIYKLQLRILSPTGKVSAVEIFPYWTHFQLYPMSSLNIKQGSDAHFPEFLWRRPVIMKLIYLI